MTLAEILRDLQRFNEEPFECQAPTIYAAEPWTVNSQAIVTWSMPKGGIPDEAAKLRLMRLLEVRETISLLADKREQLVLEDRIDELCALLVDRVQKLNARACAPRESVK
jgi:hypothetical protein